MTCFVAFQRLTLIPALIRGDLIGFGERLERRYRLSARDLALCAM
jgi:hypothetical protein